VDARDALPAQEVSRKHYQLFGHRQNNMQRNMEKQSRYTKKDSSTGSVSTMLPLNSDIVSSKWYQSIVELPLHCFIDCLVDGNLARLVIEGEPEPGELLKAWQAIQVQYADAMKDKEYMHFVVTQRQVLELQVFIGQVELLINELTSFYVAAFHAKLNKSMRHEFKLDPSNPEQYDGELLRAKRRTQGFKIDLQLKEDALHKLEARMSGKGSTPTREYFITLKVRLQNQLKREISFDMTTYEFCETIRQAKDEAEAAARNPKNHR
jgi:hypothetical protein